jgi:putative oxidoreductase
MPNPTTPATTSQETAMFKQTDNILIQRALAVLRIVSAYLLLQHGTAKLFGFPHVAYFDNLQILSLIGVAGILEVIGGALLLIGLMTRPVAFVLSGELAAAYFIGHAINGNFLAPMLNGGESAVLFCFVFLFMAAAGGGSWSVDATRAAS